MGRPTTHAPATTEAGHPSRTEFAATAALGPGQRSGGGRGQGPGPGHAGHTPGAARDQWPQVQSGDAIGRCTLVHLIQRGGMGEVWQAVRTVDGAPVAVKIIAAPLPPEPSAPGADGAPREVGIVAGIGHPHILDVHDAGECIGRDGRRHAYITMRLVRGARALDAFCRDHSIDERLRQLDRLLSAVVAIHRRGVCHFDLKPDNVLVDDERHLVVTDFGVARRDARWATDTIGGTGRYMAPEQLARPMAAGSPADVYAVGRIIEDVLGPSARQRPGGPPTSPALDAAIDTIVAACTRTDPADRPSAGRVRSAIRRVRHRPGRTMRLHRAWLRHRRRTVTCVALIAALPIAIVAILGVGAMHRKAPPLFDWYERAANAGASFTGFPGAVDDVDGGFSSVTMIDASIAGCIGVAQSLNAAAEADPDAGPGGSVPAPVPVPDPSEPMSTRPMIGWIINQAVDAGAQTIVVDLFFRDPSPWDQPLIDALERARDRNVRVILATQDWHVDRDTLSSVPATRTFAARAAGLGGTIVRGRGFASVEIELAVRRDAPERIIPSITLEAVAAHFGGPGGDGTTRSFYGWTGAASDRLEVRELYLAPDGAAPATTDLRTIELTDRFVIGEDRPPAAGLVPGDHVAALTLPLPSTGRWRRSTFDVSTLLRTTGPEPDRLRRRLADDILVIGRIADDPLVPGSTVPAMTAQAAAIESLVTGVHVHESAWSTIGLAVGGGILGLAVGGRRRVAGTMAPRSDASARTSNGRPHGHVRRGLLSALVAAGLAAAIVVPVGILAYALGAIWVYPFPAVGAAAIGALATSFGPTAADVVRRVAQDARLHADLAVLPDPSSP